MFQQLVNRAGLSGVDHQIMHQTMFQRSQSGRLPTTAISGRSDSERLPTVRFTASRSSVARPAQEGANAGLKLIYLKRLGDVVVAACVQPLGDVAGMAARREEDGHGMKRVGALMLADFQPAHFGHEHVESPGRVVLPSRRAKPPLHCRRSERYARRALRRGESYLVPGFIVNC